jgi:hypothetical protein
MREVRNQATVIGINALGPLWNPLVAYSSDDASIFNSTVANYKGWTSPMVWADSMFANLGFANQAADSMLNFLRIPDRTMTLSTWYQGSLNMHGNGIYAGVYPGDFILINYPRSGASYYSFEGTMFPFFVTSTHINVATGRVPRLDITARIAPRIT